jgi:hypothetical protein
MSLNVGLQLEEQIGFVLLERNVWTGLRTFLCGGVVLPLSKHECLLYVATSQPCERSKYSPPWMHWEAAPAEEHS